MKQNKIKWTLAFLIAGAGLLAGCNYGILPTKVNTISTLPNPLLLYSGNDGQFEAPFNFEQWQGGCGSSPVSAALNLQDANNPAPGSKVCMSMTVYSYGSCYSFTDFAFRPLNDAPSDFSSGNYSTATFWARSIPAAAIGFAFFQPTQTNATVSFTTLNLTQNWAQYTVNVPASASVTNATAIMVVASPPAAQAPPYTIYVDQVVLQ